MEEHRLEGPAAASFLKAGNALFTIENTKTGNHFTFRVTKCKDPGKNLWFVKTRNGKEDAEHNYAYIGAIFGNEFRRTAKSRVAPDAQCLKVFDWVFRNIQNLPEYVHFLHEGRCGRCNRTLTDPTSVAAGIGPECLKKAA